MRFEQKRLSGKFRQMLFNAMQAMAMLAGLAVSMSHPVAAQNMGETVIVSTLAGGCEKEGLVDGQGSVSRFNWPSGIAIDAVGNLYVLDHGNRRIRKVTPKGEVSTLAGSEKGFAPGLESTARYGIASSFAIDAADNLYVAVDHRIHKITPKGEVSILAGSRMGFADGQGSAARFFFPNGIAIDAASNLYVADTRNHRIRKVTPKGKVSTLAGSGEDGFADGQGSAARLNPRSIAIDAAGNLYVADTGNHRIRKVTPKGKVSTLVGSKNGFADGQKRAARFSYPDSIAIDAAGNLYVTEVEGFIGYPRIRKVTPNGNVSTLAGNSGYGFADGEGSSAEFKLPSGIVVDKAGNLYVTDTENHCIRKIEFRRP
jgi:sugar lactone lactonase YvrE